ncbi:16S rRNA (uracil(1498)-N(3))-methyltransferase [Marinobacterium zhoushanense]|nr:16S rRNA (uracil(1498)-N(3))-methyltransferase [Marinobacterium zhoushanense]
MNLILLTQADFVADDRVVLRDRRLTHMLEVHQPTAGDTLRVGMLNGEVGQGQLLSLDPLSAELAVRFNQAPPCALPMSLVLALPRPKMLKRTLQSIASMGVKDIWLINSYRVDKSYWGSPLLSEEAIQEQLMLGLEQAGDTVLPQVHLRKRFKPFVEDELPALAANKRALLAHPYNASPCPAPSTAPTLLAVGPEGGFIQYEVDKLIAAGLSPIHLGPRILRVETAVPVLLAKLFPVFA